MNNCLKLYTSMWLAIILLVTEIHAQTSDDNAFISPCPSIFNYDSSGYQHNVTKELKWFGVVTLSTDITLHALWLNIVVDKEAEILGNWIGEVTTEDNLDFKIENTKLKITPQEPLVVRFFIQYTSEKSVPKLRAIRFNGREICNPQPEVFEESYDVSSTTKTDNRYSYTTSTLRTTTKTSNTENRQNYNIQSQNSVKNEVGNNTHSTSAVKSHSKTSPSQYKVTEKPQSGKVRNPVLSTAKPQAYTQTETLPTKRPQTQKRDQDSTTDKQQSNYAKIEQTQKYTQPWSYTKATERTTKSVTDKYQSSEQNNSQQFYSDWTSTTTKLPLWSRPENVNNLQTKPVNNTQQTNSIQSVWPNHEATEKTTQIITKDRYENTEILQYSNLEANQVNPVAQYWPNDFEQNTDDNRNVETESNMSTKRKLSILNDKSEVESGTIRPNVNYQTEQVQKPETKQTSYVQYHNYTEDNLSIYARPENRQEVSRDSSTREQSDISNSYTKRGEVLPIKQQDKNSKTNISPTVSSETKTSNWSENLNRWSNEGESVLGSIDTSSYDEETLFQKSSNEKDNSNIYNDFQLTTEKNSRTTVRDTVRDVDNGYSKNKGESDYFGGLPTLYIPNQAPQTTQYQCGRVLLNKSPSYSQRVTPVMEGQWPWQIALYQQQKSTVDFKYICGGTLVSRLHVITAAHCVTRKGSSRVVNKVTLTVYLGKNNLRTSVDGVQIKFVNRIIVYPEYNGTTFARDLAILELRDPVTFSNWVQPACLWPEDETSLKSVVGKSGSVVGWGFEVRGVAREELSLLEMPVVDQHTCIESYIDFYQRFTSEYTYCAGYKEGTTVCNGDSGGGMVFKKGEIWYLRGLASLSVARENQFRCDPTHYVIFTDIAKFLPWIEEQIDN